MLPAADTSAGLAEELAYEKHQAKIQNQGK